MNNAPAILRTLIIYAVIVPLAVFFGYLLTNPLDTSAFAYVGILTLILTFPVLLRWHHPLLILSWNATAVLFLLPGRPNLWLAMAAVSLGITLLQRATGGIKQFISVPQVTWSLLCLICVVVFTARMTGMGLRTFGSEVYGGHRYFILLGAIMAYFALSSRRIPPERAGLYVGLFFLGGLTAIIGDFFPIMPSSLEFIYWFFPPNSYYSSMQAMDVQGVRLSGATFGATAIFSYMMAKYGIRGIFLSGKSWRWLFFSFALVYSLFGGFRSAMASLFVIFALQFYLEGLHRTKLLPIFAGIGLVMTVLLVPLAPHLPYSVQRILSVLPLQVGTQVRQEAEDSSNWRFEMWKALLPQIPQYLLLGKGYAVSKMDFDSLTGANYAIHVNADFAEDQYMALAGAYHNGPLSVVMTFGLWGVIAFVWFLSAGVWTLHRNYRYGDPALRTMNMFLLVAFVVRIMSFILLAGDIGGDMLAFGGWLGLSVALNGGVCRRAPAPAPARATSKLQTFGGVRPYLQPTLRRH